MYSQSEGNKKNDVIAPSILDYFKMDRENIHLHLNKNTYLTDENIWFKGYIIEKKISIPYIPTSNVYVSLIDQNGENIFTSLYYSQNSIYEGHIKLKDTYKTGKYYLQVFTNYMNNFIEDESSLYEITIVNPVEDNYYDSSIINYNEIGIQFFPESGVFLESTSNTFGVKINDCNDNGILVKDAEIMDSKGNVAASFTTDQFGYGRFDITPEKNEIYKAIMTINDKKVEQFLPNQTHEGITFSVNNYTFKDRIIIKLKTNPTTLQKIKNTPHSLVIQQNEATSLISFEFKENEIEQTIMLPSDRISEGINTIRLVNSNSEQIGERNIYKPSEFNSNMDLKITQKRGDSIVVSGKSSFLLSNLSISILPSETVDAKKIKAIYSSLLFDNYLDSKSKNTSYYLNAFSRTKHFELDNLLLTKKSKYTLKNLLENPPVKKYDFDSGLSVKGTVNNVVSDIESHKINMTSIMVDLNETTTLNNKNEFLFENILAVDSTSIHFSLIDKKSKVTELKLYCQVLNNNRKFLKVIDINKKACIPTQRNGLEDKTPLPKIRNAIILDSVIIVGKKKIEKLKFLDNYNNNRARGYKINETVAATFRDVLGFIQTHGYNVSISGADVIISKQFTTSFLSNKSPVIYLDDIPLSDFSFLLNYNLDGVDEIYIDKIGYGSGINGANGTIRIYSKFPSGPNAGEIKIKSKAYYVKDGFQAAIPFENPKYENLKDISFRKLGTIHWEPNINSDENGAFRFSFPNLNQEVITIIVEGISSDGKLISEIKTITVE
jgi:hypothetical protein